MTEQNPNEQILPSSTEIKKEEGISVSDFEETMPKEVKRHVQSMMSFAMRSGGPPPELVEKITSDHITEFMKQAGENSRREFEDRQRGRWFVLAYLIVGIIGITVFCILVGQKNTSLVTKVLEYLALAGGCLFGGYGYAVAKIKE